MSSSPQPTTIEDFITQDFTELPEGKSESLTLKNHYAVLVNRDPFFEGHYTISAFNISTETMMATETMPLDDLTSRLRFLIDKLIARLIPPAHFLNPYPQLA